MIRITRILSFCFLISVVGKTWAQAKPDSVLHDATLAGCVQYAITHQPVVQQSLLDEAITEKQIQAKLADWYPQVNFNYNLQHSFELPAAYFSGAYVRNGTFNSSNLGLNVTQNLFNRDVLFACCRISLAVLPAGV